MRKLLVYVVLQLKRGFKQLPRVAVFTLILLLVAGVLCTVLLAENTNSEKNALLKVGITGDLENTYLQLGILAVKEFDSSNTYVEFISMEEEDAVKGLKSGELAGYLFVPDTFMDAVLHGGKIELTYVSKNSPVGIGPLLTNEIVQVASDLIGESLTGVIAVQRAAKEYGLTDDMNELVEEINIRYVSYVLDRDDLYEVEYIGVHNGLSFAGYYVCGILFLLILLMGITCAPMMVRDNSSLVRLSRARGIGIFRQIVSEFLGFALSPVMVTGVILLVLSILSQVMVLPIPELENLSASIVWEMIPVISMLLAMQMLLYECTSDIIAGVILQFVAAVGLAYISGCFYPPYFFPEGVQTAARWLPGGVAMEYIGGILNGNGGDGLLVWGYCLLLLLLAGMVRGLRMRGERNG